MTDNVIPNGCVVTRTPMWPRDMGQVKYAAWIPAKPWGEYSCVTSTCVPMAERHYGRLGSEQLPAELEALPICTDERMAAVTAWMAGVYANAYRVIEAAYPECVGRGRRSYGEITLQN